MVGPVLVQKRKTNFNLKKQKEWILNSLLKPLFTKKDCPCKFYFSFLTQIIFNQKDKGIKKVNGRRTDSV